MKRTYHLITNVSGLTYWCYVGDRYNTIGLHLEAVEKYGEIYINRMGGWFTKSSIEKIHKTVTQEDFPPEV